jgi:tRNA threonylcarbamoyladenosine biosynthesis protein TsaB
VYQSRSEALVHHSEKLFEAIERILTEAKTSLKDLEAVAVGVGPGSFTGLRVGVTCAKTLAYANKTQLLGISSLELVAANVESETRPIGVLQDARRGRVYMATYQKGKVIQKPRIVHTGDLLSRFNAQTLYIGNGVEIFGATIVRQFGKSSVCRDKRKWMPTPEALARVTREKLKRRPRQTALNLKPQYLYEDTCNVQRPRQR